MSNTPPEHGDSQQSDSSADDASVSWDNFLGGTAERRADGEAASEATGEAAKKNVNSDADRDADSDADGKALPSRRAARESDTPSTRSSRRDQIGVVPPGAKKSRRGGWGGLVALLVIIALMAAGAVALQGPADYTGTGDEKVVVMINDAETGADITNTLVDEDVVKSYDAFYDLLLKEIPAPVFQPGVYQLATKMSARSALDALLLTATKLEQTVVVPEGTAAVDVLQSLADGTDVPLADLKAAAADIASFGLPAQATGLEGFLFPATYTFAPGITAHDAIKTLVDRQFQALNEAGVAPENRWSTIVLASLIQREAGLRDDYYKVSRVFLNRLDPHQWDTGLLQSDATVAYGTGNTHLVTTTDAERADANNPYNTYVHPGMVIGPISNPGDLAIDAALHPVDGPWLFFVTVNLDTGETVFSTTVNEHDAAVAVWQAWMAEHPEYG